VRKLTADEITALFGAYLLVQHNYGPNAGVMDEAEVNAWVERLEAGASNLPLSQLDSHQLVDLCMFLARRSYTFSQVLSSQRQSLPISWESIPESWAFGTSSSSELAADGAHSPEDDRVITAEEAMAAAKKMIGRE
jgi:hypothetical protein